MSHARLCYTPYVKEKEFINKVHKHLPKTIYRWKINDPYHGGVPDTYYSGPSNHCWIEYKYTEKLPSRDNSKIKFNLSEQQRIWLKRQKEFNIFVYAVLACKNQVYITENFDLKFITLKEFQKESIPFTMFVKGLTNFCLGETND